MGRVCVDETSLNADLTSLKESPSKRKGQGTKGCKGCGVGGKKDCRPEGLHKKP